MGEKYQLNTAGMTGSVVDQLAGYGVDAKTLQGLREFFDQYDYYRFTGSKIDATEAGRLWERANRVIKALDQEDNSTIKQGKALEGRGYNGKR